LSIGVASAVPGIVARHRDLVAAADKALYQAKNLGRNRTELAQTDVGSLAPDAEADSGRGGPGEGKPALKRSSAVA
jgi:hypothetical protein